MTSYLDFFTQTKESTNDKFDHEIHDRDIIKKSITTLISKNLGGAGRNIVDFIDLGSWDFISDFSFDDSTRRFESE